MDPTISIPAIRYGGHHGRSTAVAGLLTTLSLLWLHEIPAAAATRTVTLNGLEIGLDENNGGIVSLRYPNVGRILDTEAASAGLLDLAFPLADYVPMRLATRFSRAVRRDRPRHHNHLAGARSEPNPCSPARGSRQGTGNPDLSARRQIDRHALPNRERLFRTHPADPLPRLLRATSAGAARGHPLDHGPRRGDPLHATAREPPQRRILGCGRRAGACTRRRLTRTDRTS